MAGFILKRLLQAVFVVLAVTLIVSFAIRLSGDPAMMIMGGGIVSWLQGTLADHVGIHASFWVGVACFTYLAFYAVFASRTLRRQGIELERVEGGGH